MDSIEPSDLLIMDAIRRNIQAKSDMIGKETGISRATLWKHNKKLQRMGMIKIVNTWDNRKKALYLITEKGLKTLNNCIKIGNIYS